jgi:hypothetical protein
VLAIPDIVGSVSLAKPVITPTYIAPADSAITAIYQPLVNEFRSCDIVSEEYRVALKTIK